MKKIFLLASIFAVTGCSDIASVMPQVILPTAIPASVPAEFQGIWYGRGHQYNTNQDWTVRMAFQGNQYKVDYPSLRCGGALELISATPIKLSFREHITYGSCEDRGLMVVTKINQNTINFDWYFQNGKKGADGALSRQ